MLIGGDCQFNAHASFKLNISLLEFAECCKTVARVCNLVPPIEDKGSRSLNSPHFHLENNRRLKLKLVTFQQTLDWTYVSRTVL